VLSPFKLAAINNLSIVHHNTTSITDVCLLEEFEDTKRVIRIRKSKDRQHNGQKKIDKRSSNDLQNTSQKSKIRG
jgi:hypothetical protein